MTDKDVERWRGQQARIRNEIQAAGIDHPGVIEINAMIAELQACISGLATMLMARGVFSLDDYHSSIADALEDCKGF